MASTSSSPVMVEQPSSPPSRSYATPDFALSILSPTTSNQRQTRPPSPPATTMPASEVQQLSAEAPERQEEARADGETEGSSTAANNHPNDGDDTSNSESNSDSSTSTETPGTVSTPRSSAQDSGIPVPDSGLTQLSEQHPEPSLNENGLPVDSTDAQARPVDAEVDQFPGELSIPPPPVDLTIPPVDNTPSWVLYQEDLSAPDAEELKFIESKSNQIDASKPASIEKEVFSHIDDPDLRPCKKIRFSWVIKGVRGTKDRPNRARIMTSPPICVDGKYWNLKFFPRGNKSRDCLAAYIRCSPTEPVGHSDGLVGSLKAWEGTPDADLAQSEPIVDMELKLPEVEEAPEPPKVDADLLRPEQPVEQSESATQDVAQSSDPVQLSGQSEESGQEDVPQESQHDNAQPSRQISHEETDHSSDEEEDDTQDTPQNVAAQQDFRLSAQLGLAIYNPAEPRTCSTSSASHQFCPHQDDWGWDTAVAHWEDIHRRKHGQRQALLRDDTLAIDVYVRIYEDPTEALFWHSSPDETQWDAKGLAGVFPVGTRLLYHSPATAGIIAWTLLAPFREIVQGVDAGIWRKDSAARPRPLIAHLQLMLFQMRHMKKEELYLRLDNIIHEVTRPGESFDNVNTFWEAFRRAIEIESEGDSAVSEAMCAIFGSREQVRSIPILPVKDVVNFQESASRAFEQARWQGPLPSFLPLTLQRQSFDAEKREWQLHNDRVAISEDVDLSRFCEDGDGKYTLYGFIIHDGDRTSGKFFSLLRPHGPGGKWLAFSDGNGNKVFSHTKKRLLEYEGLENLERKKEASSPRQTIHSALYVKSSCLANYLVAKLEPFKLPYWLKPHLDEAYYHANDVFEEAEEDDKEKPIPIELFWDLSVGGQEGKLDLYKLKSNSKARQREYWQELSADRNATIMDVKVNLANILEVDQKSFKLWAMNHHRLGGVSKGYMYVLPHDSAARACLNTSLHLSLWLTMIPGKSELADEILAQNFMKIGGMHVAASPRPEPVEQEDKAVNEEPPSAATQAGSAETTGESSSAMESSEGEAAPDTEQMSVQATVEQSAGVAFSSQASIPTQLQSSQSDQAIAQTPPSLEDAAAPDAEQDSVRAAVEQGAGVVVPADGAPIAEVTEMGPSDSSNSNRSNMDGSSPATESAAGDSPTVNAPDESLPQGTPSPPATAHELPVTPSEPASTEAPNPTAAFLLHGVTDDATELPPVVHGHLFDASSHAADPSSPTESQNEPALSHGEPPISVGIPLTINNEQVLVVRPNQDEITAEDAALISSMLAADLEAAEREGRPVPNNGAEAAEGESEGEDDGAETRPQTPRQTVPDVYGFLHVFDADKQMITAHGTFMVARDTTVSSMVRKAMKYDEDRSFQLWKRDGTYRTTGVSQESTFQDLSLTDCCEVIVGEHVGEGRIEELKSEAKYVDPGQLMRYLAMVERGHPTASLTTCDSVELSEFGADYYRGPIVKGQRHGKECRIITQAGDSYEGPLVAGQKSGGTGKMTYQNGDRYEGEWVDDMKHGQGEFLEQRTGNRYVGGYENDKRWGKGITYWEQADQQAALCQVCYFEEVDALFYKCGHVVACYSCAKQCVAESNSCPVCRKPIEAVVKMFRS